MQYVIQIINCKKKRLVYYYYPLNYFVLDPLETCLNLLESKSDKHLKGFAAACLQNGHLKSFFALQTLALPYKVKILRMRSQKKLCIHIISWVETRKRSTVWTWLRRRRRRIFRTQKKTISHTHHNANFFFLQPTTMTTQTPHAFSRKNHPVANISRLLWVWYMNS